MKENLINNIKEAVDFHNLSSELHSFFTADQDVIIIVKDILKKDYSDFEINNIKDSDSNITFNNIKNSPHFDNYLKNKNKNVMIAAGGPSAEEQVVIAATDKNIKQKFDQIIYLTRNYLESNSHHSTKQMHSRNSAALYANDHFAGHKLLKNSILKFFFPKKYNISDINYLKIDIKLTFDPKLLKIYFQNEFNWVLQKIRKILGKKTSYDIDLDSAKKSLKIQSALEEINKINLKVSSLSAMEVVLKDQKNHNISNVFYRKLTHDQISNIFGKKNAIDKVLLFDKDSCLRHDIHKVNAKIAKDNGAKWLENTEIREVLIYGKSLAGIITKDNKYIYCNKLHLSLGYKIKYKFAKDINFNVKLSKNIIATGLSMVVIIKNSKKSQNIFNLSSAILLNDIYVSFIASDSSYILLKIAGGANIGSDKYKNSYFFNILYHLKLFFSDDLFGILSCYACSRSINGQNSTKFTKITDDIVISDGKGGSGNSKRYFEAAFALECLGVDFKIN
ncbi:MAG: hypothetical protein ACI9W5_000243 [Ulvibacter sp.]|jgi:hypothetical protein